MHASVSLLLLLLCIYNPAAAFVRGLPRNPQLAAHFIAPGASWRNPAAYANKRRLQPQIELCMMVSVFALSCGCGLFDRKAADCCCANVQH
jgi:hypothetical protein